MKRDTMLNLNVQSSLRHTPTMFQLDDSSRVFPKGMLEYITMIIDSWEYPSDFFILDAKSKLSGYLLILGRPWLAIVDDYIGCKEENITITHGSFKKQLTLYPPSKPYSNFEYPFWVGKEGYDPILPILTIEKYLSLKSPK